MSKKSYVYSGYVIEEETELSLAELSQACRMNAEWLMSLVDEGILEPLSKESRNCFGGVDIYRARTVRRLQQDLGVNLAGAALVLELLEEIEVLRTRLGVLDIDDDLPML